MPIPLCPLTNKLQPSNATDGGYGNHGTSVAAGMIMLGFLNDNDMGVLPGDLMFLIVTMDAGVRSQVGSPVLTDTTQQAGEPWTLVNFSDRGNGSPKMFVWRRKASSYDARTRVGWKVNMGSTVNWSMICFISSNGYYRDPIQINSASSTGPSGNTRTWPAVTTVNTSSTSHPPTGKAGLSTTVNLLSPYTYSQQYTNNGVPFGTPDSGGFGYAACSNLLIVYRRFQPSNGSVIPSDGFTDNGDRYAPQTRSEYVAMSLSITPAPDLVYPPGQDVTSAFSSNFNTGSELSKFTVGGPGPVSII